MHEAPINVIFGSLHAALPFANEESISVNHHFVYALLNLTNLIWRKRRYRRQYHCCALTLKVIRSHIMEIVVISCRPKSVCICQKFGFVSNRDRVNMHSLTYMSEYIYPEPHSDHNAFLECLEALPDKKRYCYAMLQSSLQHS